MLKQERHSLILTEISKHNKVYSTDLSQKLMVSEDTIRRDLKELADEGHIKKVHGGAMANPLVPENVRKIHVSHKDERLIIAQKGISKLRDGSILIIEGGQTSQVIADMLPKEIALTVFTNSLNIAMKLSEYHNIETFFLGGKVLNHSKNTTGMDVVNILKDIRADICLLELTGFHADIGITDADRDYAMTKKAMMGAAAKVWGMCISNDLGNILPFKVAHVDQIDLFVSELSKNDSRLDNLRSKGIKML